jgi:uncharacterized membrane-anchored protein YhcB (DUF1043 family)
MGHPRIKPKGFNLWHFQQKREQNPLSFLWRTQFMNKMFSFMAGALCGALIGGVAALLLTPDSGEQLKKNAQNRWQAAVNDAREAMEETQRQLEEQFEQAKKSEIVSE